MKPTDTYPFCDWQHTVAMGETTLGYYEWVALQIELDKIYEGTK